MSSTRAVEASIGPSSSMSRTATIAALACGVLYSVVYLVANDVIAAGTYDGYSRRDQAISELSATGAPSQEFLNAALPVFTVLVLAFGVGVWRAAHGDRWLRATGAVLIAQGLMFPVWLLFPMTSRADLVRGEGGSNDVGHLVLSALAVTFIVLEAGFSAVALHGWFRPTAIALASSAIVFGGLTGYLSRDIADGDPTRWMGVVERISYGSWLAWMTTLALVLVARERRAPRG